LERSHTPKGQRARDRILVAAERLIAAHGFHGTSMRDVAAAAKLPLATTIYHFAKKEQLYAAVLGDIAAELERELDDAIVDRVALVESRGDRAGVVVPREALDAFAVALVRWMTTQPARVKLLLRELLDNPARVARASRLPLGPFLERAATLVARERASAAALGSSDVAMRGGSDTFPEVAVLHLVGALSYFVAAWPTVERIVGAPRAKRIETAYEREAIAFARSVLGITEETPHAARASVSARRSSARSPRA
jgi:AcrR family transcriptional regulator